MAFPPTPGVDTRSGAQHRTYLVYRALLECGTTPCSMQRLALAAAGSDAVVRRAIYRLRALGLEIKAVRNRGYRLCNGLEPLNVAAIQADLETEACARLDRLELSFLTASTNRLLMRCPTDEAGAVAILADGQTGGRGRGSKVWHSPLGGGLYLSLGWRLRRAMTSGALSMIPAIAAMQALCGLGIRTAGLKWPNDILLCEEGREIPGKLGGILVELRDTGRTPWVVIGFGLNVYWPRTERPQGIACADLADAGLKSVSRNRLAAALLNRLLPMLAAPPPATTLAAAWNKHDCILGRRITLNAARSCVTGEAQGIDAEGRLKIYEAGGRMRHMRYGTLRLG